MELTNKQILGAENALNKIANTSLPIRQACKIKKTLKSIKEQIKFIEEQRIELIKKLGVENGEGNYQIEENDIENRTLFYKEYQELLDMSEEIDVRQLTVEDLERVELTAVEFEAIEFLITEEE